MPPNQTSRKIFFVAALCVSSGFALLTAVLPTPFFLKEFDSDCLRYFVMAKNVADSTNSNISYAINLPFLNYAYGMSYVYAGLFKYLHFYEAQIRGIQAINLVLFFMLYFFSLRYLERVLQNISALKMVAITATALILDSSWQASIFYPNADILPALLTVTAFLFLRPALGATELNREKNSLRKTLAIMALGCMGFFIKLSLITLPLAFCIVAMAQSVRPYRWITIAILSIIVSGVMLAINVEVVQLYFSALINGYVFPRGEVSIIQLMRSGINWISNLVFSALPDRVIPNFKYIFVERAGSRNTFSPGHYSPLVILGMAMGIGISTIVIAGAIRMWQMCKFELTCFLLCIPIFMIVTNSTSRYLMIFQPLIWACFLSGLPNLKRHRTIMAVGAAFLVVTLIAIQIKSLWIRNHGESEMRKESGILAYVKNTSKFYQGVLDHLRKLSPQNTRIIYSTVPLAYSSIRWRAATEIPYYFPDAGLPQLAKNHQTLFILTCTKENCSFFAEARAAVFNDIQKTGNYNFVLTYSDNSSDARAEIYTIIPMVGERGRTE